MPATIKRTSPSTPSPPVGLEDMLTTRQLADTLSVSPRTLDNWRSTSRGPTYFRIEGTVRYRMSDVNAWLDNSKVQTLESLSR